MLYKCYYSCDYGTLLKPAVAVLYIKRLLWLGCAWLEAMTSVSCIIISFSVLGACVEASISWSDWYLRGGDWCLLTFSFLMDKAECCRLSGLSFIPNC